MELESRYDIFEPGDLTALVCFEEPELQRIVFEQLGTLNYKIHTGLFGEDVGLKLRTHTYDVVVAYENFGGSEIPEDNQVVREANELPLDQRRKQVFVLVGPDMVTSDEMQAFALGMDAVVGVADVDNLRIVIRRAALRHQSFYQRFNQCLDIEGMM